MFASEKEAKLAKTIVVARSPFATRCPSPQISIAINMGWRINRLMLFGVSATTHRTTTMGIIDISMLLAQIGGVHKTRTLASVRPKIIKARPVTETMLNTALNRFSPIFETATVLNCVDGTMWIAKKMIMPEIK